MSHKTRPRAKRRALRRKILISFILLLSLAVLGTAIPVYLALDAYRDRVYVDPAAAPPEPVAIVFGAGVQRNGEPSPMLADRVDGAVALYKARRVSRILMTGDNSSPDYDEVTVMKRRAVAAGVPANLVNLDYAGFRTYDSCYRAKVVFGVSKAILVTQGYHLPRALYLANHLGIDAVGLRAGQDSYPGQWYYDLREIAALTMAWYDVHVLRPLPRFLGDPIDLERQNSS